MWIRSQDGCLLVNANKIEAYECFGGEYSISGEYSTVGVYSTKEKALKVLNDIQGQIENYPPNEVFQMPQDEEVEL